MSGMRTVNKASEIRKRHGFLPTKSFLGGILDGMTSFAFIPLPDSKIKIHYATVEDAWKSIGADLLNSMVTEKNIDNTEKQITKGAEQESAH